MVPLAQEPKNSHGSVRLKIQSQSGIYFDILE